MKDIIKQIKSGELSRDNDECYTKGFWDYAGCIAFSFRDRIMDDWECQSLQESIYNSLWELYEITEKPLNIVHKKKDK